MPRAGTPHLSAKAISPSAKELTSKDRTCDTWKDALSAFAPSIPMMPSILRPIVVAAALLGIAPASALAGKGDAATAQTAAKVDDVRLGDLADTLASSKNDKERIAAAVALGKLADKRVLRPLVNALSDSSNVVRAIAAVGLGRLGHQAALPALQQATHDDDAVVRKRATEAVATIRNRGDADRVLGSDAAEKNAKRAGFGDQPRVAEEHPELYVVLKTSRDDSTGKQTAKQRKEHEALMKTVVARELGRSAVVTSDAKVAGRYGIDRHNIDVSIVKMTSDVNGAFVDVDCQVRIAISNDKGKMLSFLSGGATVQVPKASFAEKYLPRWRKEALENAIKGVYQNLVKHLKRSNPS